MQTDDERASRREQRERETIAALAMIAPTPEMIRKVMELRDADDGASRVQERVVIDVVAELEHTTADR